jgi:hypothetical protein
MFSNKMLYIPDYVVYEDIPTIIKYFEDFNIAKIRNVQVFKHLEPEYYVEDKYNYCYALIEVEFYYNNQGAQNFYNAIENNKCAMVYDDPLYWEVQFSPFKEHAMPLASNSSTSTNSNSICNCLTHNLNEACVTSEEEDYYSSEEDDQEEDDQEEDDQEEDDQEEDDQEEDDSKDPDYEDEEEDEDEESDDDYNYETYKKNYANFKSKQKAKKQKLLNELSEMKKTIELIKNKQEKMRKLLIQNKKSKSKTKEYKTNWARRLRTII